MNCVISCILCAIGVACLIIIGIMFLPLGIDMYNDACCEDDAVMKVNTILGIVVIVLVILGGIVTLSYVGVDACRHLEHYNGIEAIK